MAAKSGTKRTARVGLRATHSLGGDIMNILFLLLVGFIMVIPLVYVVCNAFKPLDEIYKYPPDIIVRNPTTGNFKDLVVLLSDSWVPFSRYLFNTIFITVAGIAGQLVFASMAAYVLEKRVFPGRDGFFKLVRTTLLFTTAVTQIPTFIIMTKLGWVDTYWAIIIPAWGGSMGVYLMKQFMSSIPDSLLEAAKIDGSSEMRTFWTIVMPNVKPAWLTLIIFQIQALWAATGGVYIFSEQKKTLSYAMSQVMLGGISRAGAGAAVTLVMLIVPIAVFILSQSQILQTMASSGMKD